MSDITSCSQPDESTNFSNGITRQRASGDAPCNKKLTERELNELASQQVASTADLVIRLINYEFQNLRLKVKNGGIWFRTFVSRQMISLSPKLYRLSRKMLTIFVEQSRKGCLEGSAALDAKYSTSVMEEEQIKTSIITFNDVAEVLTKDEVIDGITFAYTFRCPAWEALPEREKSVIDEDDEEGRFQLFNRPMSMTLTMDDDECRMSRASSYTRLTIDRAASADVDKLKSVESQLAMLSQQIQLLLQSKSNIASTINANMMIDDSSSSLAVSDDEGKGPSLCSPASKRKRVKASIPSSPEHPVVLPPVAPPPGCPPPPPPPPPADFMTRGLPSLVRNDSQESLILNKLPSPCDENKVPDSPPSQREVAVRPSVNDLRTVTLRRTGNIKSPGGTPMPKSRINTSRDQGGYLANALREKFRHVNNSFSEQEDEPSSGWVDEE